LALWFLKDRSILFWLCVNLFKLQLVMNESIYLMALLKTDLYVELIIAKK